MIRKLVAFFAACAAVVLLASPASAIVNPVHVSFKNVQSGLCMDVLAFEQKDGAPVVQWDCNNLDNQKFALEKNGENTYLLKVKFNGKCLEQALNNLADRVQVTTWTCNGGPNQLWFVERLWDNPNQFQLRNVHTNKCLENGIKTAKGEPIFQLQCHQDTHLRWV